jgi:4-hydroxy-4-methyl-2-oxoglutarate aldolase
VKATAGSVNVPVVIGGQVVRPGDAVLADDDGVVCVPRGQITTALAASAARAAGEVESRAAFADGQLSLDRYDLRARLAELGIRYVSAEDDG